MITLALDEGRAKRHRAACTFAGVENLFESHDDNADMVLILGYIIKAAKR